MFANLLAASRASNRGRVGTRTDPLINAGFPIPSGSISSTRPCPPVPRSVASNTGTDVECASGCGAALFASGGAECSGDWNAALLGVVGVLGAVLEPDTEPECTRGDGVCLTNADFVPSTKRPPSGGPSLTEGANDGDRAEGEREGEEGPAPGDCSGSTLKLELELTLECETKLGGGRGRVAVWLMAEGGWGAGARGDLARRGSEDETGPAEVRADGAEKVRSTGVGARPLVDIPDAGRGMGGFEYSSKGGITVGRGAEGFTTTYLLAALPISARSASSSRRCCLSYMIDERMFSMRAVVTSSATNRLCLASAR